MKTFIKTFIHGIEAFLFDYKLKRGKPVIKQRNIVKRYCQKGVFNCSLETIEKNALYKTY